MARQGLNVVIMSRSKEKLQKVADEISNVILNPSGAIKSISHTHTHTLTEQKYSREVRTIAVDFSDGEKIYPRLTKELQDLDVGVLGLFSCLTLKVIHFMLINPSLCSTDCVIYNSC